MRVVPLALAFRGGDLLEAARISSLLTHAHPNSLEAAMAEAWLVGEDLATGRWDGDLVEEAIRGLEGPWGQGGTVAEGLRAALVWAGQVEDWLDEDVIPPGDGGWRSGSALGLAVAAALRWSDDPGARGGEGGAHPRRFGLGGLPDWGLAGCRPGGGGDPAGLAPDPPAADRDRRPGGSVGGAGAAPAGPWVTRGLGWREALRP